MSTFFLATLSFVVVLFCSIVKTAVTISSVPDVKPQTVVTYDSLHLSYKQLLTYYRNFSGYFGDVDNFWTTANSIEALANYYIVSKQVNQLDDLSEIESVFENTHLKMKPFYFTYSRCYDDYLWWVLAWKRVYDATANEKYLQQSQIIFHRLVDQFVIWNTTCGGVVWSASSQYRNAITNELFMDASTQLFLSSNATVERVKYESWATQEVNWFLSTRLISSPATTALLVIDGLPGGSCDNNVDPVGEYWTYNSGVLLDGLALHGHSELAVNISKSAISYFTDPLANDNIMRELACDSAGDGFCSGQDGKMFKGAFVRHLHYLMRVLHNLPPARKYEVNLREYEEWIVLQAVSIITKASLTVTDTNTGTPTGLLLNQLWQGPPPELMDNIKEQISSTPWVAQASALEALIAAFSLLNNVSYV